MSLFDNLMKQFDAAGGLQGLLNDNPQIAEAQVQSALDGDTLSQFASQAGIDLGQAGEVLAGLLPGLVDGLSGEGSLPDPQGLDQLLGGLLGQRG